MVDLLRVLNHSSSHRFYIKDENLVRILRMRYVLIIIALSIFLTSIIILLLPRNYYLVLCLLIFIFSLAFFIRRIVQVVNDDYLIINRTDKVVIYNEKVMPFKDISNLKFEEALQKRFLKNYVLTFEYKNQKYVLTYFAKAIKKDEIDYLINFNW